MARMYPSQLPKHVIENPKLSSEIRVYEKLRDQLAGDYNVYYSRSWHEADAGGGEFDGEADFIIAHRENGLLFLEVKGGRVSCRKEDGQWLSTDRDGFTFRIKNPISQARSSKHHFLKRIKKRLGSRFIRVRHGAILPGSTKPSRALASDAPLEIVAFGDDMGKLDHWVVRRMTEGTDAREEPLGLDGLKALEELLASHFELHAHIGGSLADDAKEIERLTGEQAWILDSLTDNNELAISGGAGSGKTVLAIEAAIRFAKDGQRTLLTCFNAPLASHLQNSCKDQENLVVASFHSLCRKFAEEASIELPANAGQALFDTHLPEALMEAVGSRPGHGFDTIIIDEGQDFHDSWLNSLRMILKDAGEQRFYVFFDDNQRLFSQDDNFISALPQSAIPLTRNLRNTRRIHALISKWYEGRRSTAIGPEGEPVGLMECRSSNLAFSKINERIARLLSSSQVDAGQIAVLTGNSADLKSTLGKIAGIETCRADDLAPNHIIFDSVRRFKGLSRPCVFVIGLEELRDPELIYVATSRANILLELAGTSEDIARITMTKEDEGS